ncbi:MAG: hypothetical protein R3A79_22230 [Nannocystaceae bacterium]
MSRPHDPRPSPAPRRAGLLPALLVALAGCGLYDFSSSATETGTSTGTDTDTDTDTDTSGADTSSQACGDPLTDPPCAPAGATTLTALCKARTSAADCLAYADGGGANKCAWVAVSSFAPNDFLCAPVSTYGECIGLQTDNTSCAGAACNGAVSGAAYYRFNDQCQVETFTGSFCGWRVLDWDLCAWSGSTPEGCAQPWPSSGAPACRCSC